jgi:hypothetical protein
LEKHTKPNIRADLQDQYRLLCKQYKNATSAAESETLLQGYNDTKLESVGIVAGILALPLSPMGWIHVVGKNSFHSFAFQNLLIIIVPII